MSSFCHCYTLSMSSSISRFSRAVCKLISSLLFCVWVCGVLHVDTCMEQGNHNIMTDSDYISFTFSLCLLCFLCDLPCLWW